MRGKHCYECNQKVVDPYNTEIYVASEAEGIRFLCGRKQRYPLEVTRSRKTEAVALKY